MSRGDRGKFSQVGLIAGAIIVAVLLAAALIGWGLSESAEYQRQADNHAAEYAAYTYDKVRKSCPSPITGDQYKCLAEARHEQRDYERNEQDLVAQRQSALWAYIMGAAAVIGVGLSIIGVFLVWTTFQETKRSADAAHSVLQIEQKPFLTLKPVDGENVIWDQQSGRIGKRDDKGVTFLTSLFCEIKSSGRSAAILTGICRRWEVSERKIPPPEIDPAKDPADKISIPVGPDGIVMAAHSEITLKPDPKHGDSWVTFYGYLEFTDLAGEESYISGFAFNYDPKSATRGLVTGRFTRGKYWYHEKKEG